ncbi:MAG: hypothetical protein IJQ98_13500 [Oscillospiraceae bacterium]|nr:hypothetical protein [Oscillospiraceae bacterium]
MGTILSVGEKRIDFFSRRSRGAGNCGKPTEIAKPCGKWRKKKLWKTETVFHADPQALFFPQALWKEQWELWGKVSVWN